MSHVLPSRRDGPVMFPVAYPSPAASPSPSHSPEVVTSSNPHVTFDASTIVVLLSFLVFTLWVVAIFLFAPSLRQSFLEYRAKRNQRKTQKQIQGLGYGFGFDGLSPAELEQLRQKEEEDGRRSFMRSPQYPPSLCAITPLPPITIPARPEPDAPHAQVEAVQAHAQAETDLDPAPVYERGDYHWQGSKCEDVKL
ncbi:hypothetical protein FB451DRAFT_1217716 [Mycena latifolia]|nr:hypothetical protein FB451DRAFT_1217716 [Mycena latifolia]